MNMTVFYGILIPFAGTVFGSGCVFFLGKSLSDKVQRALTGMAAGVMVAVMVLVSLTLRVTSLSLSVIPVIGLSRPLIDENLDQTSAN